MLIDEIRGRRDMFRNKRGLVKLSRKMHGRNILIKRRDRTGTFGQIYAEYERRHLQFIITLEMMWRLERKQRKLEARLSRSGNKSAKVFDKVIRLMKDRLEVTNNLIETYSTPVFDKNAYYQKELARLVESRDKLVTNLAMLGY